MKILYKGREQELTVDFIVRVGMVSEKTAKERIDKFLSGQISLRQLIINKTGVRALKEKIYKRGHLVLTNSKLRGLVPGLTKEAARKRLNQWGRGEISYEQLITKVWGYTSAKRSSSYGTKEWKKLNDTKIRLDPNEIRVTQFELDYGEKKERDWGFVDA